MDNNIIEKVKIEFSEQIWNAYFTYILFEHGKIAEEQNHSQQDEETPHGGK